MLARSFTDFCYDVVMVVDSIATMGMQHSHIAVNCFNKGIIAQISSIRRGTSVTNVTHLDSYWFVVASFVHVLLEYLWSREY